MIQDVRLRKQIDVTVANKIGVLADMSKILADQGINIEAVAGYAAGDKAAKIMLVVDKDQPAIDALKKAGYSSINEIEIIIMELENKTGALKYITAKLVTESIDIKQVYGTVCSGGCPAKMVLSTSNNEKALTVLKK